MSAPPSQWRSPFEFSRWKEEPHVALANLRDDPAETWRFTCTYGVLAREYRGEARTIPVADVFAFRDELRQVWGDHDERAVSKWLSDDVKGALWVRHFGTEIVVENLWTLIRLMFMRDYRDERLTKCARPDCVRPYFLAVRKSHKFCSHHCAVLATTRRFRAGQAKARQSLKQGA